MTHCKRHCYLLNCNKITTLVNGEGRTILKRLPNKLFLSIGAGGIGRSLNSFGFTLNPLYASPLRFSIFDNMFALEEYVLKPNLEDYGEEVGGEEEDEDCLVPARKVFIISFYDFIMSLS